MKASELIEKLKQLMEIKGDLPVYFKVPYNYDPDNSEDDLNISVESIVLAEFGQAIISIRR